MKSKKKKRVVHLIPSDELGGVEVAAKSLSMGTYGSLIFERMYLRVPCEAELDITEVAKLERTDKGSAFAHTIWRVYKDPPNLMVVSLWRSALILICLRFLRPRLKLVLFLHSVSDAHFIDKLITRLSMHLCDKIWVDSDATLQQRVTPRLRHKGLVISFLLNKRLLPNPRDPSPNFIFWGRLNYQKRLDFAIEWFASFLSVMQDATFTIIGPDGGSEIQLRRLIKKLDIAEQVIFTGALDHSSIVKTAAAASFYLQTSSVEGMAISVVEAMQLGLVPVVTPVGEIARYCKNGENAVFVDDSNSAKDKVLALLQDPDHYRAMAQSAANYWQSKPLYRDDFINAARDILELSGN